MKLLSSLLEPWKAEVALTLPADIAVLDTQITARSQRQLLEKFRLGHSEKRSLVSLAWLIGHNKEG